MEWKFLPLMASRGGKDKIPTKVAIGMIAMINIAIVKVFIKIFIGTFMKAVIQLPK